MDKKTVVKVENVSKKFCRRIKHVMLYGFQDIVKDFFGIKSKTHYLRSGEFWAVDNVSFELNKGETLGIIGLNGSGKSTILKMINGIFMPDSGIIEINGKVGALIEVGAGFHPLLTGRENIYINGSILGMSKKELDEKFDEIVDFSELRDFIDTPVKFYSSGMFVRLGFAVAVFCNPEILLIDEILSVGDISFQNKAFKRLYSMKEKANGIIYVGHNMQHIRNMCDRIMVIDSGKKLFIGDTLEGIKFFHEFIAKNKTKSEISQEGLGFKRRYFSNYDNEELEILKFGLFNSDYEDNIIFEENQQIIQYCIINVKKDLEELEFTFGISDEYDRFDCLRSVSSDDDGSVNFSNIKPGQYLITLKYENPHLASNLYYSTLSIRNPVTGETYERIVSGKPFSVIGGLKERGVIKAKRNWQINKID